jgi:hypothetical protein
MQVPFQTAFRAAEGDVRTSKENVLAIGCADKGRRRAATHLSSIIGEEPNM